MTSDATDWHQALAGVSGQLVRGEQRVTTHELLTVHLGVPVTDRGLRHRYWARELTKLGHEVRLMPAKDVKAYVKRNKNDAADAEAICEAVRRPTMRFVQAKSAEQQGRLFCCGNGPRLLTGC
jgi:transposase